MSNKEAINVLQDMIDYQWGFSDTEKSKGIEALKKAIEVLKLIPDNATNGEVIKALFPQAEIEKPHLYRVYKLDIYPTDFTEEFWNAPYKKGEQEWKE